MIYNLFQEQSYDLPVINLFPSSAFNESIHAICLASRTVLIGAWHNNSKVQLTKTDYGQHYYDD